MKTILLSICALPLLVHACPQAVPEGLTPAVVAEKVEVSGLRLSILQVRGKEDTAAILARVEKQWKADGYTVKRTQAAGWNVVSALDDSCMATLQLVDQGGAHGYFAVNPLRMAAKASLPWMPPGGRVLSSVRSEDDGRKGTITALESSQPLEQLRDFYMRTLRDENWKGVRADALRNRERVLGGVIVSAQKGRERVEVMLWREGATQIVINRADAL